MVFWSLSGCCVSLDESLMRCVFLSVVRFALNIACTMRGCKPLPLNNKRRSAAAASSGLCVAERVGFEPTWDEVPLALQASALGHSATSPRCVMQFLPLSYYTRMCEFFHSELSANEKIFFVAFLKKSDAKNVQIDDNGLYDVRKGLFSRNHLIYCLHIPENLLNCP